MFYSQVYEFAVGPFATHDVFLLIIKYYVLLERQFKTSATNNSLSKRYRSHRAYT